MTEERLEKLIESLVNTQKMYINQNQEIIKDHEKRLRFLERYAYILLGLLFVIQYVLSKF